MEINKEYTLWVNQFNALYHDARMNTDQIMNQLGEEPIKYLVDEVWVMEYHETDFTYCPDCDEYHQFYNPLECPHCNFTIRGGD